MLINKEMFDISGPQLVKRENDPEPTLRRIIVEYYRAAFDNEESDEMAERYIDQFIVDADGR